MNDAFEILDSIKETSLEADQTVEEVDNLSFDNGEGQRIEEALDEAQDILNGIKNFNFTEKEEEAADQLAKAFGLLENMRDFNIPVQTQWEGLEKLKSDISMVQNKLNDISNYTKYTLNKIEQAENLNTKHRGDTVKNKIGIIEDQANIAVKDLEEARVFITNASDWLADAHRTYDKLKEDSDKLDALNDEFNKTINEDYDELDNLDNVVQKAVTHSENLSIEVHLFNI